MRLPIGFQLIEPLEHCSGCGKRFTEQDLREFREESNMLASFGVEDDATFDDYPEICTTCAENEEPHEDPAPNSWDWSRTYPNATIVVTLEDMEVCQ